MKHLLLAIAIMTSSCAYAQEESGDYSYQLAFPLLCTSVDDFLLSLPDGFKPVIEFLPPEKNQSEFSTPSYLFMNEDGEFFITMPADVPDDICYAQNGVINRMNPKVLLEFLGQYQL
jgi:hypothetical protein